MGIGIKTNIGIPLFGSAPSFSWQSYWTQQSECYEQWDLSRFVGGNCVGLKRGDVLTRTGSAGRLQWASRQDERLHERFHLPRLAKVSSTLT